MSIPQVVRSYLSTEDGMLRAQLAADHPELDEQLGDPSTRQAVVDWLRSGEAQQADAMTLVAGSLAFLRTAAEPEEAPIVRQFILHPEPAIRMRAFEFLLTLYFPDRNLDALLLVLQSMLADSDDAVRTQGARYVERAGAAADLAPFLQRWVADAPARSWDAGEAAELIERLLSDMDG